MYRETVERGWVDLYDVPIYHPDGKEEFLVRAPILDGVRGHFKHIMKVHFGKKSRLEQPVTHGAFEVKNIHGWDQTREHM